MFRIQDDGCIMCGFYCIALIEYRIAGKSLLDEIYLLSPSDYRKNGKITYKYFKAKYVNFREVKYY